MDECTLLTCGKTLAGQMANYELSADKALEVLAQHSKAVVRHALNARGRARREREQDEDA